MKQSGNPLAPIDEKKPVSKPQKDEIIVPVSSLAIPRPRQPQLPRPDLLQGSREDYIKVGIPLYEASIKGDWSAAKAILDQKPELVRCSITENCETALHIAASAHKTKRMQDFVKNLVARMDTSDLELQNSNSNTALNLAAAAGNVKMVKILLDKNPGLLTIPGSQQMMPLYMAALFGKHVIVEYLYSRSNELRDDGWNSQNRGWLLLKCVEADLFDIALKVVKDRPELASDGNVLGVLAKKPYAFYETRTASNIFNEFINWAFGRCIKLESPKKDNDALQLLRCIWKNIAKKPKKEIDEIIRGPSSTVKKDDKLPVNKEDEISHLLKLISDNIVKMPAEIHKLTAGTSTKVAITPSAGSTRKTYPSRMLFVAAEMGNTMFIVELIRLYPDLIWKVNDNNLSIFHIAVKHRHEGIYNLLYEIGSMKDLITPLRDENDNNMLHLVGKSASRDRLEGVSGVALQMQREYLWFQEVENMIPPSYRERKNKDGLTPRELFTKEHKNLAAQGEKWMKETASHCMVVAALIATIVFVAAFAVPGGYSQNHKDQADGIPIFHSEATFMIFLMADAISLCASTTSILVFLSILTSRYAERDFLRSLPEKLLLGVVTLFLSIAAMTIAFSVSFYVVYKDGTISITNSTGTANAIIYDEAAHMLLGSSCADLVSTENDTDMKQAGVQLASIDEQITVSKPQQDEIIVPVPIQRPPHQPNLPRPDLLTGSREDYINVGIPLYEASIKGDWKVAKAIIDEKPELVRFSITENCETALHVAASANKTKRMQHFVKNLLERMEKPDLELQNKSFNTVLCLAAAAGNVEMVKILFEKNPALLAIPGSQQMMPLYMAALFGDHAVVEYLYSVSKGLRDDGWDAKNRGWLLQKCVESNLFDIALQIVKDRPELASDAKVLEVLAKKPEAFSETTSNIFKKLINWVFVRRPKQKPPKKDSDALQLLRIIWENIAKKPKKEIDDIIRGEHDTIKKDDRLPYNKEDQTLHLLKQISKKMDNMPSEIQKLTAGPSAKVAPLMGNVKNTYSSRILFVAAELGNTKFIVELIRKYPDLIWKVNDNNQSIFHIAVKHRHEGIYNLLYEIGSMKDLITPLRDGNENNMLHLVGKSAKQKRLQDVSGVALQMQRELLWFKEVEAMIPPTYRERKNKDGLTPHELFTKEHKDLVAQGEKWMKGTASQCMVVAALIATIVFAAAFTVPGGYNQTTGIPIFHSKATFMTFVVSDAISLFASAASILMFLSILTSRYAERDFLQSLPKKLMLGLATLFLSITTMTIAFSVSFFVLYNNGLIWMPIVISLFAVMPVVLFAWLQYPLLGDVFRSSYGSRYLFRPKTLMLYYDSPKPKILIFFTRCLLFVTFGLFKVQE
ncbi:hypothetical protein SSX86_014779 [Deinandra increscens subsp. villosa]|uniref:PGG domain-containing protein n=1 Tax=Deinandra increscens subsp. villosa TaxID=3103831 RepID=A0AAP0D2J4_9ASTR